MSHQIFFFRSFSSSSADLPSSSSLFHHFKSLPILRLLRNFASSSSSRRLSLISRRCSVCRQCHCYVSLKFLFYCIRNSSFQPVTTSSIPGQTFALNVAKLFPK